MYRNRSTKLHLKQPVIATLGNFDGLHRGHQALFERVRQLVGSSGGTSVVISFYPHPALVLKKATSIPTILSLQQKCAQLSSFGMDALYLVHFTQELSKQSAREFILREVIGKLDVQHLVIGPDAHIGRGREGSPQIICELMHEFGRQAEVASEVMDKEVRISSGLVRTALAKGDLKTATRLLGFPFRLWGRVVRGAGRGAKIGIPTANLHTRDQQLPPFGVYATYLFHKGKKYLSVTNIGVRPTFSGERPSVEAHILSYEGASLGGHYVELEPIAYIRPEQKFSGPSELVAQIRKDIETVKSGWGHDSSN